MTRLPTWIALIAMVFALGACTEHKIYRSDLKLCTSADPNDDWSDRCRTNALQTFETAGAKQETYSLGFIEGAVLAKRDAWARIAGCMREEAGSVVGSVIV